MEAHVYRIAVQELPRYWQKQTIFFIVTLQNDVMVFDSPINWQFVDYRSCHFDQQAFTYIFNLDHSNLQECHCN